MYYATYKAHANDCQCICCRTVDWNYCVLDEGHIIKNAKTKVSPSLESTVTISPQVNVSHFYQLQITKSIKQLRCNHRLILTGTPIQVLCLLDISIAIASTCNLKLLLILFRIMSWIYGLCLTSSCLASLVLRDNLTLDMESLFYSAKMQSLLQKNKKQVITVHAMPPVVSTHLKYAKVMLPSTKQYLRQDIESQCRAVSPLTPVNAFWRHNWLHLH